MVTSTATPKRWPTLLLARVYLRMPKLVAGADADEYVKLLGLC